MDDDIWYMRKCPFRGCWVHKDVRTDDEPNRESLSGPIQRKAISQLSTVAYPASSAIGFLDLPAELRNAIYHLVLVTDTQITLTPRSADTASNKTLRHNSVCLTLLQTCRQIYHEALPVLYGQNSFYANRSLRSKLIIPREVAFITKHVKNLSLQYPLSCGLFFDFGHFWGHLIRDSRCILSHFRQLKTLTLQMEYTPEFWDPMILSHYSQAMQLNGWAEVYIGSADEEDVTYPRRVKKLIRALHVIEGESMPSVVSIRIWASDPSVVSGGIRLDAMSAALTNAIPRRRKRVDAAT